MTAAKAAEKSSIKETVTSIIIAFAMAFVFRGFVLEPFLIPTGSMAPTLMGAHMEFTEPQSGYSWAVDPWDKNNANEPLGIQGTGPRPITVHDPMSGISQTGRRIKVAWGDRIFVMKYLFPLYEPDRFDVVVFKNPNDPGINYIKRLIGLRDEQVALIDGDVFVRKATAADRTVLNPWALPGWSVARKPARAQREMWQEVFDSRFTPLTALFTSPWRGVGQGSTGKAWEIAGRRDYSYTGAEPTRLEWNNAVRPINDSYAYNEGPNPGTFPVSDVRMSLGLRPGAPGVTAAAVLATRGHEFRAEVSGSSVTLSMRRGLLERRLPDGPDTAPGEWTVLATGTLARPLAAGEVTNLDVWFVDQTVALYVDDTRIAEGRYDWMPEQRVGNTLGLRFDGDEVMLDTAFTEEGLYPRPRVWWEFSGGPFTLYRVALGRDIFYRPGLYHGMNDRGQQHSKANTPAAGTHPRSTLNLNNEQFFVCGDNSPASLDARLWDTPHPWVAELDETIGVVHQDLFIGKAFFVYFPALKKRVPQFGDMRFIW